MINEQKKMTVSDSSVGADDGQSISKNSDMRNSHYVRTMKLYQIKNRLAICKPQIT